MEYTKKLGEDIHTYLCGVKMNGMKEAKTQIEYEKIMELGRKAIKDNGGKIINFY